MNKYRIVVTTKSNNVHIGKTVEMTAVQFTQATNLLKSIGELAYFYVEDVNGNIIYVHGDSIESAMLERITDG